MPPEGRGGMGGVPLAWNSDEMHTHARICQLIGIQGGYYPEIAYFLIPERYGYSQLPIPYTLIDMAPNVIMYSIVNLYPKQIVRDIRGQNIVARGFGVQLASPLILRLLQQRMDYANPNNATEQKFESAPLAELCSLMRVGCANMQYESDKRIDSREYATEELMVRRLAPAVRSLMGIEPGEHSGVILTAELHDKVYEAGWKRGAQVQAEIEMDGGVVEYKLRIWASKIDLYGQGKQVLQLLILNFERPEKVLALARFDKVAARLKLDLEMQFSPDPTCQLMQQTTIQDYHDHESNGYRILQKIYTSQSANMAPFHRTYSPVLLQKAPTHAVILERSGPREITWEHEQRVVFGVDAQEQNIILNLDAGAGTGKTTTVAGAILERLRVAKEANDEGVLILAVAVTNTAVAQIANTILKFTHAHNLAKVLRYLPITVDTNDRTAADLSELVADVIADHSVGHDADDYREQLEYIYEKRKEFPDISQIPTDEIAKYNATLDTVCGTMIEFTKKAFNNVRPNVICVTQSTLLRQMAYGGPIVRYINRKERDITIWVDEASQMAEGGIYQLAKFFPYARQRYVGDPMQLQPFCMLQGNSFGRKVGARGCSAVLLRASNVPRLTLRNCRRMPSKLVALPSNYFYSDSLKSSLPDSPLCAILSFPVPDVPYAFVDVRGICQRVRNGSRFNIIEAKMAIDIAARVTEAEPGVQIAFICFYAEQVVQATRKVKEAELDNVEVITVDSAQGKEWDVVLVLSTRTISGSDKNGVFIGDRCRLNVAMTRAKKALFVLGHSEALRMTSIWGQVIDDAREKGMVVREVEVPSLFVKPSPAPASLADTLAALDIED